MSNLWVYNVKVPDDSVYKTSFLLTLGLEGLILLYLYTVKRGLRSRRVENKLLLTEIHQSTLLNCVNTPEDPKVDVTRDPFFTSFVPIILM